MAARMSIVAADSVRLSEKENCIRIESNSDPRMALLKSVCRTIIYFHCLNTFTVSFILTLAI